MTMQTYQADSTDSNEKSRFAPAIPLILLATGLLLYLPWLGSYGPLDPTDSFFIESGREAFETNQYLLPLQNYKPWLDKPILYFWSVAGSYQLLGVNPFAGRLVSALSAVYIGLTTFWFARPYIGRKEAAFASAIFMTLPLTCAIGHLSLTDMPLTALMSTALLAIFHFEKSGKLSACVTAYVALALAFLCKGPIAVIIDAAIYGLYLILTGKPAAIFKRIMQARPLLGLLIMLVVNVPWYTAAAIGTNGLFLKDFFITQNFGRMVGAVNHQQPFWFYIPVVLGGLFPWSLLIITTAIEALIKKKNTLKSAAQAAFNQRTQLTDRQAFLFFMAIWAVFVLALFTAIKTKLPTYILPGIPPLAVLIGVLVARLSDSGKQLLQVATVVATTLTCATVAGIALKSSAMNGWVHLFLTDCQHILYGALATSLAVLLLLLFKRRIEAVGLLLGGTVLFTALLVPFGHIAFYKERQEPFEQLIKQIQTDGADIATVVVEAPSLSYFLHRRVEPLKDKGEAEKYLQGGKKPHYLLVPKEIPESLKWFTEAPREIGRTKNGKWTLYALD